MIVFVSVLQHSMQSLSKQTDSLQAIAHIAYTL